MLKTRNCLISAKTANVNFTWLLIYSIQIQWIHSQFTFNKIQEVFYILLLCDSMNQQPWCKVRNLSHQKHSTIVQHITSILLIFVCHSASFFTDFGAQPLQSLLCENNLAQEQQSTSIMQGRCDMKNTSWIQGIRNLLYMSICCSFIFFADPETLYL